jgi:cytochrome c553
VFDRAITKTVAGWFLLSLAAASVPTGAEPDAQASAREQHKDFGYCLVCHGSEAAGNQAIGAPNLTTLTPGYMRAQIKAFASGFRGRYPQDHAGQSMTSAVRMLDSPALAAAAVAFIDRYPASYPVATTGGDAARGKELYGSCIVCHGASGEGEPLLRAPALVGQNDWYLSKQLRDYRTGKRGAHPGDQYGNSMRSAAMLLPDDTAVDDLAAYIQAAFTDKALGKAANDLSVQADALPVALTEAADESGDSGEKSEKDD